jgi:hypothetical protein
MLEMKFYLYTFTSPTNSSVAGGSPTHSKNLIPFSLSRSSKVLYYFKNFISVSESFIDFAIEASLSSSEAFFPTSIDIALPVFFLKLPSGILSSV